MNPTTVEPALSPLVRAAARGDLPAWACVKPKRREHMRRVAELLGQWARDLRLSPAEADRWVAAGWLHDAMRDCDVEAMREIVPAGFRDLHPNLLHGPAAAELLAGHADDELRDAVRFHTLGSAGFGALGRALYLADFMEPGRTFSPEWTAALRARMPHDAAAVLREVVAARVAHVGESGEVHPETLAFHRAVAGGAA